LPTALRWLIYPLVVVLGLAAIATCHGRCVLSLAYPNLPSLEILTDYRPKIPLRVFTADGHLLGEFGEERRAVVSIQDVPAILKQAILAAEDERFYQHGGVDTLGVLRALHANLLAAASARARRRLPSRWRRISSCRRRRPTRASFYEALLSFKIESNLSKDQIFELYINQIFLGQRAYGFAAAAHIYFGKPLAELTLAEAAMLAGLPKAPSAYNPVVNPKRAASASSMCCAE
jgi:penicillin-binding protein 1A